MLASGFHLFFGRGGVWGPHFSGKASVKVLGPASGARGTHVFCGALKCPFARGLRFPSESEVNKGRGQSTNTAWKPRDAHENGDKWAFQSGPSTGRGRCPFPGWQCLATWSPNSPSIWEMPGWLNPRLDCLRWERRGLTRNRAPSGRPVWHLLHFMLLSKALPMRRELFFEKMVFIYVLRKVPNLRVL